MSKKNIFNILGFQLSWWACVLGVVNQMQFIGPIFMTLFLIFHFMLFSYQKKEIIYVIIVGLIGLVVDTIFLQTNLIKYEFPLFNMLAPLWIIYMWLGFAATVNHSMYWLEDKIIITVLFGLIFGPLSYMAGVKFGALELVFPFISMIVIGITWAFVLPLLFNINRKIVRI
tara:strand:+ start:175 stop:687 length:513 start_codon:yes stop_codon:yes gene_type:complete